MELLTNSCKFTPLYILSRLLGLMPYSNRKPSKFWSLYSVLVTITLGSICYGWKVYHVFWIESDHKLVKKLLSLAKISLLGGCTGAHVISVCKMNYNNIDDDWGVILKETMFNSVWNQNWSGYSSFWTPIGLLWVTYFYPGYIPSNITVDLTGLAKQFSMFYYESAMLLITMQFCTSLHAIILEILQLRTNFLQRINLQFNKAIEREDYLLKTAVIVNKVYGKQLLIACGHIFFSTVSFLFHITEDLAKSKITFSKDFILATNVVWQLSKLYCVCEACHRVNSQVSAFNNDFFKLLRRNPILLNKENILTCRLRKPFIKFTACGFFDLGFPLVTSVITASATYLIILVQFNI